MNKIGHKAILASAGSGKTFQLAHRYIRLLAEGLSDSNASPLSPDRICAMTFTRKAAGEIFDEIANYLRLAASDEDGAASITSERIDMPQLKSEDYLKLLRSFIDGLNRARIGTFDSFIIGIAKAFPVELGIPMNFQVMDSGGASAQENRQRILDHILGGSEMDGVSKTFLESFKQATFGHEEKMLGNVLDSFLARMGFQYRLCPDGSKWGVEEIIWPKGRSPYSRAVECDGQVISANVTNWAGAQDQSTAKAEKFYNAVKNTASELAEYSHTSSANNLLDDLIFGRMLTSLAEMRKGDVEIKYDRGTYTIPAEIGKPLADLIHNMLVIEYKRMLNRTAGLFKLLSTYEKEYEEITRVTGSFSFTDIQYLLAGSGEDGEARYISREQGVDRLYIDYRMDCRLDHWLLDEFQDTSDLQWAVFDNLISEIVQSGSDDGRSFFYVGDVKQAIYRWRGGNHELFLDIINKFNENGKVIDLEPMQKTYRCSQPVIDVVNKVFTKLPEEFPSKTADKWSDIWENHETVSPTKDLGYVALLESADEDSDETPKQARCRLVADMLNEIQPVQRGLRVGILVRGNDFGKELVNVLTRECEGMNFVHEGESGVTENEVAGLLIAMVKVASHPGDEYAWKYIQMTPMFAVLAERGITRSDIAPRLLAEIQENGFQSFVRNWGSLLAGTCDLGVYGLECLDRFESASAEFDALGTPACNSFLRFMESYTIREQPSSKAVRVMTIHQSKGLEFDIVILPDLQTYTGSNMTKDPGSDLICAGGRSDPDWILKMPKRIIAENDPTLNDQLEEANAAHCFDSLCMLYVAMTRARHGLYMVTSRYKTKPKSIHPSVFLKKQLTGEDNPKADPNIKLNGSDYVCLHDAGKGADWYKEAWPISEDVEEEIESFPIAKGYSGESDRCKVLHHREPSKQSVMNRNASTLFEARSTDIMNFGSAIHEMFEQVEWSEDADIEKIISEWRPTSDYGEEVTEDAVEQFRNCMQSDAIKECLSIKASGIRSQGSGVSRQVVPVVPNGLGARDTRHSPLTTLWCEKRFEIVLDNEFVSGAFDRVIIVRDEAGTPESAVIIDYKSSLADTEAKLDEKVLGYTAQMTTYRDALSVILGLPKEKITLKLLFTKQQIVKTVQ